MYCMYSTSVILFEKLMLGQCIDPSQKFDHGVILFLRSRTSSVSPSMLYVKHDRDHDLLMQEIF